MIGRADLQFFIFDSTMANRWPVMSPISAIVARGKQPSGSITLALRSTDPALSDSGLMAASGEAGALYLVGAYLRDFSVPLQIARCQVVEMGDVLVLTNESLWSDLLRARLVFDSGTGIYDSITGYADDVLRAYWRANLSGTANIPINYPRANRTEFGGLTVVVEADTSSHPTSVTYDVNSGQNIVNMSEDLANKFDLRCTMSLSSSTVTLGVAYPYQKADASIAAGMLLTTGLGTLRQWKETIDLGPIRNTWLVQDGTNRTWGTDNPSVGDYGNREGVVKIETGGGATSLAMRDYERDDQLATLKDPISRHEIVVCDPSWMQFGLDYSVADLVTAADYERWSRDADLEVVDVTVELPQGGGAPVVKLGVGAALRDHRSEAWIYLGPRGGREHGSRFTLGNAG